MPTRADTFRPAFEAAAESASSPAGRRPCFFLRTSQASRGSVLVGLLWCLALLSIVVIGVLHTARMDLMVGKNHGDRIQAHYLALAGIEKAKALLYQNARERSRSRQNHSGNFYNSPNDFRDVTLGRGTFSVIRRGRDDEGGGVLYGVSDEESRINVNTVSTEALGKLDGMTSDVLAAITDWRDGDNSVSPGGAESEYYLSLPRPYQARNGRIQTIRELLMVRGVSSSLLFGNDSNLNGLLDSEVEDGKVRFIHPAATDASLGWAGLLTTDSTTKNVNAAGEERVNAQSADEAALTQVPGISADIARVIVSYRGQNQFQSIADLLDVTSGGSTNRNAGGGSRTVSGQQGSGPKVISEELLMEIADDITVDSNQDLPGLININTASLEVLATLPGLDRELAQAIIAYRQSSGFFPNVAYLLKVSGFNQSLLKQVGPLVTARSETYRILSEGRLRSGARQRIEVVVHIGLSDVTTFSYREDNL